ncbi:uncharacterized protein LOC113521714 [Galleria mellonella]|uniref:Uncharacterized protein LOC113521714 n=1 Tax=Galleria mellonella TaxID=7137 RepID=A0A6J1X232_GALME|nr:uncharacterized protein LOC113521714 [Galleria mellonella]
MLQIPDNVREDLMRLVPLSIFEEIACFVFYDNHPRDNRNIDVIICTYSGKIKEYFQREEVGESYIPSHLKADKIIILRNSACKLFYVVAAEDHLFIFKRDDIFDVHKTVNEIKSYTIEDVACTGQPCLKVIYKRDARPLICNDKFDGLGEQSLLLSDIHVDENVPILNDLKRKLIETQFILKYKENIHQEFINLRQMTTLIAYQKINPNFDDSVFKSDIKDMAGALRIKTSTPWVKMCNKNIVIILEIINDNENAMEDVHILLHSTNKPSLVYSTKLFQKTNIEPFWIESKLQTVECNKEYAIIAVIDIKEMKENVISSIEFSGVLVYKANRREYILPFEPVNISTLQTMGENFDVLSSDIIDPYTVLSILSTTQKNDLYLRHVKVANVSELHIPDTFCKYLGMEQIQSSPNIVIHRNSPYHILHSVMIVFPSEKKCQYEQVKEFSVYTRTPDQIISLIHLIHDAVPYRMVITTPDHRIVAKHEHLKKYNEELSTTNPQQKGYVEYANAMLNQTEMLIEHLNDCMVKMNESKVPEVQQKIGQEIDVLATGLSNFQKLKTNILQEESRGLKCLRNHAGPD